jgi:plasmid replication initiation protein
MAPRPPPSGDHQPDLFAASFADIPIRDQRDTMERPFFSLAKKPRFTPIEYRVGDVWVEVSANPQFGMATIWDADILIWASTQITEALDHNLSPSRTISFHPYNLLRSIRRTTGGHDYDRLRAALERLTHTAVRTNIRADGKKKFTSFHWLDAWDETIDTATGEPTGMTLTLPDWLYDGIIGRGGVLTIHEDYFLLTGGIERWFYRVVRKHAGNQQAGWSFTMRQLYEKSGSSARPSDFALDIRQVIQANTLPEYELSLDRNGEGDEIVRFVHRTHLTHNHPRLESPRFPGRRKTRGIFAKAFKLNALPDDDSGEQA